MMKLYQHAENVLSILKNLRRFIFKLPEKVHSQWQNARGMQDARYPKKYIH